MTSTPHRYTIEHRLQGDGSRRWIVKAPSGITVAGCDSESDALNVAAELDTLAVDNAAATRDA